MKKAVLIIAILLVIVLIGGVSFGIVKYETQKV